MDHGDVMPQPSAPPQPTSEEALEVCRVHGERVYLVCRDEGCKSALLCVRCVLLHKGHEYDDVEEAFGATKAGLQPRLSALQAQLREARLRETRASASLDSIASAFTNEQAALQLHCSTARVVEEENVKRTVVVSEERQWRTMLQAQEAHCREVHSSERAGLTYAERLGRAGITASHELQHETHRRLFRGGLERIALLGCITQLSAAVALADTALALPDSMPRMLQKHSADLGPCTEGVPAGCSVTAVDAAVWSQHVTLGVSVKAPAVYPAGGGSVWSVALSPCMRLCCVGTSGALLVYDTCTGEQVAGTRQGIGPLYWAAFSRCGTHLATVSEDGTIGVFRTATWECVHSVQGHTGLVTAAGWTHCGNLAMASSDQSLCLWGVSNGSCLRHRQDAVSPHACAVSVSQGGIYAVSTDAKTIHKFAVTTLQHTHSMPGHSSQVYNTILTADEQHLMTCSTDRTVKVWCTSSHTLLHSWPCDQHLWQVAAAQVGQLVAVKEGHSADRILELMVKQVGTVHPAYNCVARSPCGRWVFSGKGKDSFVEVTAVDAPSALLM